METTASILRRRNGSQQACEPCRKGKIACDHALPTCGRCKRRKTFSQCQYVQAPMSKARLGESTSRRTSITTPVPTPTSLSPTASFNTKSRHNHASTISGPFNKSSGFYGSTSFSAIFLENQSTFPTDLPDTPKNLQSPDDESIHSPTMIDCPSDGKVHLRMDDAIKALRKLPDKETFDYMLQWMERLPLSSIHNPSIRLAAASIWTTFGQHLKEPRRQSSLEAMAQTLFRNGESALEEPEDYQSWLACFSGSRLRWEVMGIVFCRIGIATTVLPVDDHLFTTKVGPKIDKRQFGLDMKECSVRISGLEPW